MKLTALIMLTAVLQVGARTNAQTITLSVQNAPLTAVFSAIQHQTGLNILVDARILENAQPVSLNVKEMPVDEVMRLCLRNQPFQFSMDANSIIVKPKPTAGLVTREIVSPVSPPVTVRGRVVDEEGKPLEGVTVSIDGKSDAVNSDVDGNYSIILQQGDFVLIFSFVGYSTKRINTEGRQVIDVQLFPATSNLNQVVVVGFGTQKKSSVTAAISTLNGKDVALTPITNLSNSLVGRIPGVIARQNSGEPGNDQSNIFVRGISSTGANQPLLIVDNIPRDFRQLDPNTIESFTVLKDAAAVAPYGVAGANGVILVTTKSGKTGAPSITYTGYVGVQNPTIVPHYVSGYQFGVLQNAAAEGAGLPLPYSDIALQKLKDQSDPDAYPDPNVFRDVARKDGILTNHNLEVSGGTEKVKYYGNFGYQKQDGMWPTDNNKKFNLNLNMNVQATKTTRVSFGINGRLQNAKYPGVPTSDIFALLQYTHTKNGPIYYSNGIPGTFITGTVLNSGYTKINTTAIYSQLSVDQELSFIPGLTAKVTVAYDPTVLFNKRWTTPIHIGSINTSVTPYEITDGLYGPAQPSLNESFTQSYQLTYQTSLNYARSFGNSNVSALALFEGKDNGSNSLSASRRNYSLTIDEINQGSSSNADMTTGGTSGRAKQVGMVYRVTYDYASKYLFEASGRYDGSYYFAPGKQFGFFPAFSVGWRLSEENFIKGIPWINNLKIRGSYGEVGALAGAPFQHLTTFNTFGPAYVIGRQAVQGALERSESNPNITWERAKKSDVGFEATLWNGLLNIEADYFFEKRSNMLVIPDVIVPAEYGIGLSQVNAGVMKNQGIDLSIGSNYRIGQELEVSLSGNVTYAKNTLLSVFETSATFDNPNRRLTGKALGTQFGLRSLGFFQLSDFEGGVLKSGIAIQPWGDVQPGDIRYEDINNDGKIDNDDITKIGDPIIPQLIYGIMPAVRFKDFALDMLFQGAAKTNVTHNRDKGWAFVNGQHALIENMNYWTPDNPNALNPRITAAPTTNNTQTSSFWMKSAAYLRLKAATLSYTLPISVSRKIGSQNARVYVSGQNIITWTKLKNFDPEMTATVGENRFSYPQQKVISVGLNITF